MAAPVLWGSEFSVNTKNTAGAQVESSVIAFADGSFLVVWADNNVGGDIVGQFFSADGTRKGEAFTATGSSAGAQGLPQAALLNNGRYVVAWSSRGSDPTDAGVWARIFDKQGQGGSDLYVGDPGVLGMQPLSVSALGDGFVVAYTYISSFFSSWKLHAYAFDANGNHIPDADGIPGVVVNTTGSVGDRFEVVELGDGHYAVFFDKVDSAQDTDGDIRCRVLSATGEEIVPEFRIPASDAGPQWTPSAARLNDGRIVVAWEHADKAGGDGSGSSIRGRIIDPQNWQSGQEFQVNIATTGDQGRPQLTALADGGFAVTYRDVPDPIGGGNSYIRIATFNADVTARGEVRLTAGAMRMKRP